MEAVLILQLYVLAVAVCLVGGSSFLLPRLELLFSLLRGASTAVGAPCCQHFPLGGDARRLSPAFPVAERMSVNVFLGVRFSLGSTHHSSATVWTP